MVRDRINICICNNIDKNGFIMSLQYCLRVFYSTLEMEKHDRVAGTLEKCQEQAMSRLLIPEIYQHR